MPRPMTSAEIAALEALQEFAHLHELCRNGGAVTQAMHHEAENRLYAAWAEVEAEHDGRWTAPEEG